jgi:hypothetical protein
MNAYAIGSRDFIDYSRGWRGFLGRLVMPRWGWRRHQERNQFNMNEQRRILDLLANGKITAQEADQLLSALGKTGAPTSGLAAAPGAAPKWLRISIVKAEIAGVRPQRDVDIRIPLALVRAGMKLGVIVPQFAGEEVSRKLREKGIDLSKVDAAHFDDVIRQLNNLTLDVDDGKHQVRVFCE